MKWARWTEQELELLETLWPKHNTEEICRRLNRSRYGVMCKAYEMGLGAKTQSSDYVSVLNILTVIYGPTARGRVQRFIEMGLPARKSKVRKKGTWIIKLAKFWKWAEGNQDKLNFARFEKYALGQEPDWVDIKRKADFAAEQKRPKEWTLAEDTALKALINLPREEVARRLGRSTKAVINRYWKLRRSEQLC